MRGAAARLCSALGRAAAPHAPAAEAQGVRWQRESSMSEMIARANTILLHARRATVVLAGGLALAFFALVLYRLAWGSLTLPWITFLIALLGFLAWAILARYRALDLRFREDGIEQIGRASCRE